MNPRQRRGVLLMITAAVGAVLVFVMVINYVGNERDRAAAQVGQMTTVLAVQTAIPAFQPIGQGDVVAVEIPRRWTNQAFVTDVSALQGKVAATSIPAGAYLQQGMLVDAPSLKPGQREIAIMIDAETGVAGKVQPGSIVDVYSTFDATNVPNQSSAPACAVRILSRVQVIEVGQVTTDPSGGKQQSGSATGSSVPVTFALDSQQVLSLTYAESYAHKVRLALVGGAQDAAPPQGKLCETPQVGK